MHSPLCLVSSNLKPLRDHVLNPHQGRNKCARKMSNMHATPRSIALKVVVHLCILSCLDSLGLSLKYTRQPRLTASWNSYLHLRPIERREAGKYWLLQKKGRNIKDCKALMCFIEKLIIDDHLKEFFCSLLAGGSNNCQAWVQTSYCYSRLGCRHACIFRYNLYYEILQHSSV